MKNLINDLKNNSLTTLYAHLCLTIVLGLTVAWMEWASFSKPDFNELIWLCAILFIFLFIRSSILRQHPADPIRLHASGVLLWLIWKFLQWIFASRVGWIYGLVVGLLFPFRQILPEDYNVINTIIWTLTIIAVLLSLYGSFWLYKNFNLKWMRKRSLVWCLLIVLVVGTSIYSGLPSVQENCFGLNAISEGLSCHLRSNLGLIGSIWVFLIFFGGILGIGLNLAKSDRLVSQLWIVALQPVLIAVFFNPARILGVVLFKIIRETSQYNVHLENEIFLLNIIQIIGFFGIIPIGLFLLKSDTVRTWWTVLLGTGVYMILLSMMLQSLESTKTIFSYSPIDQVFFCLMAIQSWLPLPLLVFYPKIINFNNKLSLVERFD